MELLNFQIKIGTVREGTAPSSSWSGRHAFNVEIRVRLPVGPKIFMHNGRGTMTMYGPMYIQGTEMVGSYYSKLHVKNKRVLTVIGSGDQVLNAYFFGAENVTGFDINNRSYFITALKIAAIKKLSYKEFLAFFTSGKKEGFDYHLYVKIRPTLNQKIATFFDKLYRNFDFTGPRLIKSKFFRQRPFLKLTPKIVNAYLKDEGCYLQLKKKLSNKKIRFIQGNIKDLAPRIKNERFDIINLSNIPNYFIKNEKSSSQDEFLNILLRLREKLTTKGKIFYYFYSDSFYPNKFAGCAPPAYTVLALEKMRLLRQFQASQIDFSGIKKGTKDRIMVLEKN